MVSQTSLGFVGYKLLVDSCEISAHPFQSLVTLRQYQYQKVFDNVTINVPNVLLPLLKNDQSVTDNALSTKMSADRQYMYMGRRIPFDIPVIDYANKNYSVVSLNRSVYDASLLFQTNLRSLVNNEVPFNATVTSNPFMFFWINRDKLAEEFLAVSNIFYTNNSTVMHFDKTF